MSMSRGCRRRPSRSGLLSRAGLAIVALCLAVRAAAGADVVELAPAEPFGPPVRVTGQVLDFTAAGLTIQLAGGREASYPAARVRRIDTAPSPAQQQGDAAFQQGKYDDALAAYGQAAADEPRGWVRRRLLAQAVRCYRAQGRVDRALVAWQALAAGDPLVAELAALPAPWKVETPPPASLAALAAALNDPSPAVQLAAAAWLLPVQRASAESALERLSRHDDPRIALLAEAQRWRLRVAVAPREEVDRWRAIVARLPEPLAVGPWFVVGEALARQGDFDGAALAYLRAPLVGAEDHHLAAEGWYAAGRALEQGGAPDEAQRAYRTVVERYGSLPAAAAAQSRLSAR